MTIESAGAGERSPHAIPTPTKSPLPGTPSCKHRNRYRSDEKSAANLISYGESKPGTAHSPVELAAYTLLANLLLNLDETVIQKLDPDHDMNPAIEFHKTADEAPILRGRRTKGGRTGPGRFDGTKARRGRSGPCSGNGSSVTSRFSPFCPEGQAAHLPAHERGAVPDRSLRSQAAARNVLRCGVA